jgi:hypothetical protein
MQGEHMKTKIETSQIISLACKECGIENTYQGSVLMKTMAEIPFRTGCKNPKDTAIKLVALNVRERALRNHPARRGAWAIERLKPIKDILLNAGGNSFMIRLVMFSLYIIMLHDYKHDQVADKAAGKYNPLNDGVLYWWEILKAKFSWFSALFSVKMMQNSASLATIAFCLPLVTILWWDN